MTNELTFDMRYYLGGGPCSDGSQGGPRCLQPSRNRGDPLGIVVHHTGYGGKRPTSPTAHGTMVGAINTLAARTGSGGPTDFGFGYHYIIPPDNGTEARDPGVVYRLVDDNQVIWHASNVNTKTIGVSLLALDDADVQTQRNQIATTVKLIRQLQTQYKIPDEFVFGHSDVSDSKEPSEGDTVVRQIRPAAMSVESSLAKLIGRPFSYTAIRNALRSGATFTPPPPEVVKEDTTVGISPYIDSLESFHPKIQYELVRRSIASETANTYMPYVRLTALMKVSGSDVGLSGELPAWCPSLGVHGENTISYEDIYNPVSDSSIVAYAITHRPTPPPPPSTPSAPLTQSELELTERLRPLELQLAAAEGVIAAVDSTADAKDAAAADAVRIIADITAVIQANSIASPLAGQQDQPARAPTAAGQTKPQYVTTAVYAPADPREPKKIPMPGITKVTTERGTAGPMGVRGGLFKADLSIVAYSIGQVDTLLRYFLRPATRVVLEFGRKSSNQEEKKIKPYDWKQSMEAHATYFQDLILSSDKQKEFIKAHTYASYGNYEALIGYVVKFNLKYNKDNTYLIDLTVHSVQQFEIPTRHTGVKSLCSDPTKKCQAMDIHEYFDTSYSWKDNSFSKLMERAAAAASRDGRIAEIRMTDTGGGSGGASTQGGTRENEYFVTWRFFVERILNDSEFGIRRLFGDGNSRQVGNIAKMGLLQVTTTTDQNKKSGLLANEVGYHPALRSTNPSVMIIYNQTAQNAYDNSQDKGKYAATVGLLSPLEMDTYTLGGGLDGIVRGRVSFTNHKNGDVQTTAGAGWLHEGVWLNTTAIKQAFTSADTVSDAMSSLLNMMNDATEGYWNLQLYSTDAGMYVIDMGLSKEITSTTSGESLQLQPDFLTTDPYTSVTDIKLESRYGLKDGIDDTSNSIYVFNKKALRYTDDDVGSDILDLNVEFNLPQVIAVQAIAGVGGPAQKSTLQSINIPELNKLSLVQNFTFLDCETNCGDDTATCKNDEIQRISGDIQRLEARPREEGEAAAQRIIGPNGIEGVADPFARGSVLAAAGVTALLTRRSGENRIAPAVAALETQLVEAEINNPNLINLVREYPHLGTGLELIEFNPSRMMRLMNLDSRNEYENRPVPGAHAFNSSNLTKTVVDVTTPGIGGINLFQSFLVDRIPSIMQRGFYVVTKVSHEFSSQSGWTTKIQGRFRFRPDKNTVTSTSNTPCADTSYSRSDHGANAAAAMEAFAANQVAALPSSATGAAAATPRPERPRVTNPAAENQLALAAQRAITTIQNSTAYARLTQAQKAEGAREVTARLGDAITRLRAGTPLSELLPTLQLPQSPAPSVDGDTAIGYRIP